MLIYLRHSTSPGLWQPVVETEQVSQRQHDEWQYGRRADVVAEQWIQTHNQYATQVVDHVRYAKHSHTQGVHAQFSSNYVYRVVS